MEKIPTLFERDPTTNFRYVRDVVHPACQWVIDGEGVPTRKYDGACFMYDGNRWWARREIKPDREAPPGYLKIQEDPWTGKTVGWEPAHQSGFSAFLEEALEGESWEKGTYELVGPKINKNPEGFEYHTLIFHGNVKLSDVPLEFEKLGHWLKAHDFEGIVWWNPDGRRAKLKKKDYPA